MAIRCDLRYLVPDGARLPVTGDDGKPDHRLMGAAWAALHGGYRGSRYAGPDKEEALAALKALYKSEGMELPSEANSAGAGAITFSFVSQLTAIEDAGQGRIPILVTGDWVKSGRKVSFTLDELNQARGNFAKLSNHDLNVDYDHACEDLDRAAGDATPSAGKITSLDPPEEFTVPSGRRAGEKCWILYGRYDPTEKARALIKNREYRYSSAAFSKSFPDCKTGESQGLTLTSVALTNQPFLDELPEIWLSVGPSSARPGAEGSSALHKHGAQATAPAPQNSNRLKAETKGDTKMSDESKELNLKCSADGKHVVHDGDTPMGQLPEGHLCDYAKTHLSDKLRLSAGGAATGTLSASDSATMERKTVERFSREIGAEGKSQAEIRGLVTLALNPPKAEITLLSECVNTEGRLDEGKLNVLDDSGQIARSGYRRAQDAMNRVDRAYQKGQITPAMLVTGAPLRLALSDGAAFRALIEERPALVKPDSVIGIGGTGSETGESPRQLFGRLVEEKKTQLMAADNRLRELDAHRKAGALVAKENPDLLKNYRTDSQKA